MMSRRIAVVFGAAMLIGGCATPSTHGDTVVARGNLASADGSPRGTVVISARGSQLNLRLEGAQLPPGIHGVHLHAVGTCEGPKFTSAGPHLNPYGKVHGTMNPQGSHMGDLLNLPVSADGSGSLIVPLIGSRDVIEPLLFDGDGVSLVIHASADDYMTDPSGKSGDRIACAVLTQGK